MADGRVRIDGHLTRTGVFVYRNPDGTERREYRPPEEVFNLDSLDTFAAAYVTDDHPPEAVTIDNRNKYQVGSIDGARRDGNHVAASVVVYVPPVVAKIKNGKRDLSVGYQIDLDETPGTSPEGERYDAVQRNIRVNHVAIVDVGRAGPSASLRLDAAVMVDETKPLTQLRTDTMDELKKALQEKADAEVALAKAEIATAAEKTRADGLATEMEKLQARHDGLEAEVTKLKKDRTDADEKGAENFDATVAERVELYTAGALILDFGKCEAGEKKDPTTEMSKMKPREIQLAIVEKIDGVKLDDKRSDEYVSARADSALERARKGDDSAYKARAAGGTDADKRADEDEDPERAARNKMIARNKEARTPEKN